MLQHILGYLSGVLAYLFYAGIILSILRGQSKPSRTTWTIWSINDLLIFCSSYYVGARNTLWVPLVYVVCSVLCLVLSLKNDPKPIGALDRACLALSLLAWVLWGFTHSAFVALVLGVAVNTLGAIPTWRRVWHDPHCERWQPWSCIVAAAFLQLAAVEQFSVALVLFPLDSLLVSGTVTALAAGPRKRRMPPVDHGVVK